MKRIPGGQSYICDKFPNFMSRLISYGLVARKPVFGGLRTTQAQPACAFSHSDQRLLFAYWRVSYLDLLQAKFQFLASLCSLGDWFESHFVGNPKDRFCRDEAHITKDESMSDFNRCY